MTQRTISHMQHDRMNARPNAPSYFYYENETWKPISNKEASDGQTEIGMGLWSLGIRRGDRIAVMSNSRYEWDMIDGGALGMGACVVSIYPTSTADATDYILNHSGSKVVFLENKTHWELVGPLLANQPNLDHVVVIDSTDMPAGDWIDLDKLRSLGKELLAEQPDLPKEARDAVDPDDLASLMYTSGTTGRPKGVALTHNMLYTNVEALQDIAEFNPGDTGVIYLPMSHILQRVNVYLGRYANVTGYFAPDITEFVMTCQEAHPRSMSGVPRVFEKVHARILAQVEQAPENRQKTFHNAVETGIAYSRLAESGQRVPLMLRLKNALFERMVFKPLRSRLFGDNIEFLTVGAAPISKELLEFYYGIGLPVLEGYGLTETCSPITINRPDSRRIGTVGQPLPGSEVKIADDGEILLKGPSVFQMYYENEEATADSFTEDGYFMSGDIGELDADGFLRITDRKKYLIITAAGKNIAPAPIEQKLLQHPLIGQVVVHGDQRKFLSALLTLDPESLEVWAKQNGKGFDHAALSEDGDLAAEIEKFVNEVNSGLAQYETIKKYEILPLEFTVENGFLTPSMKLKRKVIEQEYVGVLDEMYA